ncbi:MAG TPA: zf-HC2 domain-containing protein [Candidatus Deferrimicrobiaceae bacterium]
MDCRTARRRIEEQADGLLPREEQGELSAHLSACEACAAEERAVSAVGPLLRAWTGARAAENAPRLDAMWTRVRAGIEERGEAPPRRAWIPRWAWLPAALALAVSAVLLYPTGTGRQPFHPRSFDVAVEDVESDTATVALVDKGEDLPRVIWIIEDAKS